MAPAQPPLFPPRRAASAPVPESGEGMGASVSDPSLPGRFPPAASPGGAPAQGAPHQVAPTRGATAEGASAEGVSGQGPPEGLPRLGVWEPGTGRPLGHVPIEGEAEIAAAVLAARRAGEAWAALPVKDRARRLMAFHRVLGARAGELADLIHAETGKPEQEALGEVVVLLDQIRHLARVAPRVLSRERVGSGWLVWKRAWTVAQPWGVVGIITPWNYPLLLPGEAAVTALMAGNGVVVKPSEFTPFTGLRLAELARDAGLPDGLLGVVTGGSATGAALVAGGVDRVVFVGSSAHGRSVMAAAAEHLVPVTLELVGKDPALVLEDADLERAARGIVWGAFYNAGQSCVSVERVYVVDAVHDRFVARAGALLREIRTGIGPGTDMGPMVTPTQLRIVEEQITDALQRGARIAAGGGREDPGSRVLYPTLLVQVDDRMKVMRQETFGPILPVIRVRDEEEAVARANAGGPALFASVWTGDRRRGEAVAMRLKAGGVSVNDVLSHWSLPGLPVGGTGESGFGFSRGTWGLREFSRRKSILVDRGGRTRDPWWYPYTAGSLRLTRAATSWRRHGGLRGMVAGVWRILRGGDP